MTATQEPEHEARPPLRVRIAEAMAAHPRLHELYAYDATGYLTPPEHADDDYVTEADAVLAVVEAEIDRVARERDGEITQLTAEVERLQRDLAAWTSGRRRKAWPRIESVPDVVYLAAELARSQGTEGGEEHDRLLREASQRLKALHDTAQVLLADRTVLSGLLRDMARKVSGFRQSLKFADAHVPRWDQIISEHKTEIKRLEENEDFLERAVHLVLGCCDASDVPCELLDAEVLYEHVRRGTTPVTREALSKMLRDSARKTSTLRRSREKWRRLAGAQVNERVRDMAVSMANAGQLRAENRRVKAECDEALAEACRLREQLVAGQALVIDFRQRAEQTVVKFDEDGHHDDECGSAAECHASAQHFTWKLAASALEKALAVEPAAEASEAATPKPCTCNGGWSVDENYQPEDYERNEPLRPEKGLIACGLCNHGGWDAPWPPETDEVAVPRAPGAACSDDELVEQTSRRLQRDFRLRIGPNTRRHIIDGQELIPLSLRECDDVARAAVTALEKVTRA